MVTAGADMYPYNQEGVLSIQANIYVYALSLEHCDLQNAAWHAQHQLLLVTNPDNNADRLTPQVYSSKLQPLSQV